MKKGFAFPCNWVVCASQKPSFSEYTGLNEGQQEPKLITEDSPKSDLIIEWAGKSFVMLNCFIGIFHSCLPSPWTAPGISVLNVNVSLKFFWWDQSHLFLGMFALEDHSVYMLFLNINKAISLLLCHGFCYWVGMLCANCQNSFSFFFFFLCFSSSSAAIMLMCRCVLIVNSGWLLK